MSEIRLPNIFKVTSIGGPNGILHYFEDAVEKGFPIRRIFWIHDVPNGGIRGGHAHIAENQMLVCLAGKLSIELETLSGEIINFQMSEADQVLYVPAQTWCVVKFQEKGMLLGISDREFSEADYLRDKKDFEKLQRAYRTKHGILIGGG